MNDSPDSERSSYLTMVWARLRRNRIAFAGLWAILTLIVLATCAPLIAHNQPLIWQDAHGSEFPFVRSLFNRLVFENAVDVFFNLLLVLSPLYVLGFWLATKRSTATSTLTRRGRKVRRVTRLRAVGGFALLHATLVLLIVPERFGPVENPFHYTARVRSYAAEAETLQASGQPAFAVFPWHRYGYRDTNPGRNLEPPSREHWLGTDTEGRDVLARMVYGTRISLTIGVIAVAIYVTIGIVLGALAGYLGGKVDICISRLVEVMICFPSFFLILTIAALIEERSIFHVMVIIGLTSWTGVARLIRAEFLKNKSLEYVQGAIALGIRRHRIIFRHVLPNAIAPALVSATFGVASAILIESSLAFLGIGDLTVPSWGETLNAGRTQGKLWLVLAPGVAIFFVVSVFNLVGEGLRDALDPKLDS